MNLPYDYFENGFGYIRLENLQLPKLPESIEVDGEKLVIKPEFHISLVWVGRLKDMVDEADKEKVKRGMIEEFENFVKEHPLDEYELTNDLRFVRQAEQKSVIVMADMPNLKLFFERLSHKYGVELPLQPAHITLYTLPSDKIGIGIFSQEELTDKTVPIDLPEIKSALTD